MRKNILMLLTGCLAAMTVSASNIHHNTDSIYKQNTFSQEQMLLPMNPTYLKNVSEAANWGRNWFIEIKGGASAFLMNTPCSSFLVCNPFLCLKKISAAPVHRVTARMVSPATNPRMQYTMIKLRIPPPTVAAAQVIYLPWNPINSRGF